MHEHYPFFLDDHPSPAGEHVDWFGHHLNGLNPLSEYLPLHEPCAPDHDFTQPGRVGTAFCAHAGIEQNGGQKSIAHPIFVERMRGGLFQP